MNSAQFHNSCAIWALFVSESVLLGKLVEATTADFDRGLIELNFAVTIIFHLASIDLELRRYYYTVYCRRKQII